MVISFRSSLLLIALVGLAALPAAPQFFSNDQFVNQQYRDIARRNPSSSEWDYWRTQAQGPSLPRSLIEAGEVQAYQAPIVRLYFAYFNRMPDYDGFVFWTGEHMSGARTLLDISWFFAGSPEFSSTYGSLTNGQFVNLVYQNVLQRAPDSDGYNYWVGRLDAGLSRPEMMLQFSDSQEHINMRWLVVNQIIAHARILALMPASLPAPADFSAFISDILSSAEYASRIAAQVITKDNGVISFTANERGVPMISTLSVLGTQVMPYDNAGAGFQMTGRSSLDDAYNPTQAGDCLQNSSPVVAFNSNWGGNGIGLPAANGVYFTVQPRNYNEPSTGCAGIGPVLPYQFEFGATLGDGAALAREGMLLEMTITRFSGSQEVVKPNSEFPVIYLKTQVLPLAYWSVDGATWQPLAFNGTNDTRQWAQGPNVGQVGKA